MQTAQPGLEEAGIRHVVSSVSAISKEEVGIDTMSQSDIIRGASQMRRV